MAIGIVKTINGVKQLVPLTTDSGQGLPLGAWTSFEDDQPRNGYLKAGTTFNQSDYPALYTMLGTNVVPDKGYGLDWDNAEAVTLSTTDYVIQKNGWIVSVGMGLDGITDIILNGIVISRSNYAANNWRADWSVQVEVKAGDVIKSSAAIFDQYTRFVPYLHPMFIKAVIGPIEDSAADQVLVQAKNAMFPNYARGNIASGTTSYTCTEDCYVTYMRGATTTNYNLTIDGVEVSSYENVSGVYYVNFNGFVKKGSVISTTGNVSLGIGTSLKVFGLV